MPNDQAPRTRRGLTLLEIVVALALIGMGAMLVAPSLDVAGHRVPRVGDVVRTARGEALHRAESLALDVLPDGSWRLTSVATDDGVPVREGVLRAAPSSPLRLRLTPLGACIATAPLPAELEGWDAARCSARSDARPST